ncbi:cell division topological specificity factor MinE [Cribrihabitans sp. XS_ASV171]
MSLFGFAFKPRRPRTAQTARDRLQLLLAHERLGRSGTPDFLPQLQNDLLEVIRKYVQVDDDGVEIVMQREDAMSSLEINIELPPEAATKGATG